MQLLSEFVVLLWCTSFTTAAPFEGKQKSLVPGLAATTSNNIKSALKKAEIIPDVLSHHVKPSLSIHLSFPPAHDNVSLGNVIPTSNVSSRPSFEIHTLSSKPTPTEKNTTYTLVLTDPDATSRADPVKAQMCHWIITGFKLHSKHNPKSSSTSFGLNTFGGSDQDVGSVLNKSGLTELMSYIPPAPPPKTGYHRYVFVLLAPKDPKDSGKDLEKPKDRPHWGYGKEGAGVREWAKDNGLVPVGANFFYAQNKEQ